MPLRVRWAPGTWANPALAMAGPGTTMRARIMHCVVEDLQRYIDDEEGALDDLNTEG